MRTSPGCRAKNFGSGGVFFKGFNFLKKGQEKRPNSLFKH